MDYPPPRIDIHDDQLVVSDVYAMGPGVLDNLLISYGYGDVGSREAVLQQRDSLGIPFLQDWDNSDGFNPLSSMWDDGSDPIDALAKVAQVRRLALYRFSFAATLSQGTPLASLREPLVTTFLWHRYQVAACVKFIGGGHYGHQVRQQRPAPGFYAVRPVSAETQRRALAAVLETLSLDFLSLPPQLLAQAGMLPPLPADLPGATTWQPELFPSRAGNAFDVLEPSEVAAAMVLHDLLSYPRLTRLQSQSCLNASLPDFGWLLDQLSDLLLPSADPAASYRLDLAPYPRGIAQARLVVYLDLLLDFVLRPDPSFSPVLLSIASEHLTVRVSPQLESVASQAHDSDRALFNVYLSNLNFLIFGSSLVGDVLSGVDNVKIPPGPPMKNVNNPNRQTMNNRVRANTNNHPIINRVLFRQQKVESILSSFQHLN